MSATDDEGAFFRHARDELFPKMKDSFVSMTLIGADPDPKFCLELGAAIMFDKPIIALNMTNRPVPASLAKVAVAVIRIDPDSDWLNDPVVQARMRGALRAAGLPIPEDSP